MKGNWIRSLGVGLLALPLGCAVAPGDGNQNTNDNDSNEPVVFDADLTVDQETDPVNSSAGGTGTFTLDAERTELQFNVSASGLSGPVIAAHFHFGPPGVAGDIVFNLSSFVVEENNEVLLVGTAALADWGNVDDAVDALLDGNIYINLHTELGPAGEIRGQLVPRS